ncbi:hypothetical protein SB717_35875, partial [Priestia sp. SIMBA_032]|uniref:hypothetical protein n=1 Tax=Priestia sp. SIMBA_032 TaxID=3085775 RepID=UPI00397E1CF2
MTQNIVPTGQRFRSHLQPAYRLISTVRFTRQILLAAVTIECLNQQRQALRLMPRAQSQKPHGGLGMLKPTPEFYPP